MNKAQQIAELMTLEFARHDVGPDDAVAALVSLALRIIAGRYGPTAPVTYLQRQAEVMGRDFHVPPERVINLHTLNIQEH